MRTIYQGAADASPMPGKERGLGEGGKDTACSLNNNNVLTTGDVHHLYSFARFVGLECGAPAGLFQNVWSTSSKLSHCLTMTGEILSVSDVIFSVDFEAAVTR